MTIQPVVDIGGAPKELDGTRLVLRFRSSIYLAAPSDTNFGSKEALASTFKLVPLIDLKFLKRPYGRLCRNFKSAALA
jgi:hypothetical protein